MHGIGRVLTLVVSVVLFTHCGNETTSPAPTPIYPILFVSNATAEWQPYKGYPPIAYTARFHYQNVSGLPTGEMQIMEAAAVSSLGQVYPTRLPYPWSTDLEPRLIFTGGNSTISITDDQGQARPPATHFRLRVRLSVEDGREEVVTQMIPLREGAPLLICSGIGCPD